MYEGLYNILLFSFKNSIKEQRWVISFSIQLGQHWMIWFKNKTWSSKFCFNIFTNVDNIKHLSNVTALHTTQRFVSYGSFFWIAWIHSWFFQASFGKLTIFLFQWIDYSILALNKRTLIFIELQIIMEYWVLRGTWLQEDFFLPRMHQAMTRLLG